MQKGDRGVFGGGSDPDVSHVSDWKSPVKIFGITMKKVQVLQIAITSCQTYTEKSK